MAINKKNQFDQKTTHLADFAKALSHPARLEIMMELAKSQTCICGEIVDVLPLSQSTVSQHLKELKKAGLISGTIDGVRSCYCVNWKNFNKALKEFEKFSKKITDYKTSQTNCC